MIQAAGWSPAGLPGEQRPLLLHLSPSDGRRKGSRASSHKLFPLDKASLVPGLQTSLTESA